MHEVKDKTIYFFVDRNKDKTYCIGDFDKLIAFLAERIHFENRKDYVTQRFDKRDFIYDNWDFSGGDVHWDILAKYSIPSDTLSVLANGSVIDTDSSILNVVTMTDGHDRGYRDENGDLICNPDTPNTLDSQAFDIVTIAEDGVYFTRIGSGNDRVIYFD